jgi:hypothetical protein
MLNLVLSSVSHVVWRNSTVFTSFDKGHCSLATRKKNLSADIRLDLLNVFGSGSFGHGLRPKHKCRQRVRTK